MLSISFFHLNSYKLWFCRRELSKIILQESDLIEKFVLGGGPGGQSVNKSRNRVQLTHRPTGIQVNCQDQRDLDSNRKIARRRLCDKLDLLENKEQSRLSVKHAKIRRRKERAWRRSKQKYHSNSETESLPECD